MTTPAIYATSSVRFFGVDGTPSLAIGAAVDSHNSIMSELPSPPK